MTPPFATIWAPVQVIVDVLRPVLVFFHDTLQVGWGMSIVLLTVCVRALLLPLMVKQFKSMQAMVSVGPELKKIQEKYKDDKQRQQQEVMKFYAENKINPFASCLPTIAQLPFFLGLYYLLKSDLRFEICGVGNVPCGQVQMPSGAEKFLFIPDLTASATGWVLAALMVLYVGSQLLSSFLMPSSVDPKQKMLMYALPLVFAIFILFYDFPAGLLVYWITTNLWTVGQGYLMRRKLGPISAPKLEPAPAGGGSGRLFAKLSEAADASVKSANASAATKEPALAKAKPASSGSPPPPPRKKKKRSGRRR
ncbi:MAG TPA: YidC/Oxa1 family membrane protein insertase [Solirubrobacteraceae bacterium]